MRLFALTAFLLVLMATTACVRQSEYEKADQQLKAVRTQLDAKSKELEDAKTQIDELSQHKFSVYQNGGRTWRFDASTGRTCLMLASETDWKRKGTKDQSCNCMDTMQLAMQAYGTASDADSRKLQTEIWNPVVKDACGN
jgi:hypothetical protein